MTVGTARKLSATRVVGEDGHVTYTAVYGVTVTDQYEWLDDISVASGIPFYGDPFTWGSRTNQNAICNSKVVNPVLVEDTNLERTVTCTFTTKPGTRVRSEIQHPADEPWKVGGSYAIGTRVTSFDKDGVPIITTGLERKAFEVPDGYDTLQLEGPSDFMSLSQRAQAVLRCNSATIWGLTARKVFMNQWQWQPLIHAGRSYFYHRMDFWIKYAGWNEVWPNMGTQEYVSGNPIGSRIVPIVAANDAGGRQERFLDVNGRIIADNLIPGSIVTKTTQVIPEFDFTALASIGLPNPLPGNFV